MAHGTLLQLDQSESVEFLGNSPGASFGQVPQSRQASRELVLAKVDVMGARSRFCFAAMSTLGAQDWE